MYILNDKGLLYKQQVDMEIPFVPLFGKKQQQEKTWLYNIMINVYK